MILLRRVEKRSPWLAAKNQAASGTVGESNIDGEVAEPNMMPIG